MLDRLFQLHARGSTVGRELRGALATFLTMAYILFVNPTILAEAGVPADSAVACTAAAAGICCILMGLGANFPLALASGMGLNAVVAYQLVQGEGLSWQTAMGLVVLDGLVVLLLVLCGLREAVMHAIPRDLRRAIGAGIGLFIAFIGMVNAGIVIRPKGGPPVTFGNLTDPAPAVAGLGLLLMAVLVARKVQGAIVLGILAATLLAFGLGVAKLPDAFGAPSFENAFQADVVDVFRHAKALPLLLALILVDFFDTLGTVTAIADQAGLHDEKGRIPRLKAILLVDALSASIGGLFGASSVTSYIESAAGVAEGARTGLHSVGVGILFLLAIFAAPIAGVVPPAATAPALIIVGFLMAEQIAKIDFADLDTGIPAFITLAAIPFTYSITHGIGFGFIAFVVIKCARLKFGEVHALMYATAAVFVLYFVLA
jgi:AGZA family xanthine/uracil permease-like MFS transporter